MKRMAVLVAAVGLAVIAASCGPASSGSLGPVPTGSLGPVPTRSLGSVPTGSLGSVPTGSLQPAPSGPTTSATAAPTSATPTTATPSHPTGPPAPRTSPTTAAPVKVFTFENWFVRDGKLFVTQRSKPLAAAVGRIALNGLLAGPSRAEAAAGVSSAIPSGTRLLGLQISGGVATVDLSGAFESGATASTMPVRLAQVVYTITQFSSATGVRFQIDGQGRTVVGGVPVQQSQTRAMDDGWLPAIVVKNPPIGATVSNPVTVSGTADVFEAAVSVRIIDAAGNQLARTFTTATCGTGCRGDYSVSLAYAVAQPEPATIEAFEVSAKDGSAINVQSIPVTLSP